MKNSTCCCWRNKNLPVNFFDLFCHFWTPRWKFLSYFCLKIACNEEIFLFFLVCCQKIFSALSEFNLSFEQIPQISLKSSFEVNFFPLFDLRAIHNGGLRSFCLTFGKGNSIEFHFVECTLLKPVSFKKDHFHWKI